MTAVSTYLSSRELFVNLVMRELRSKYKRSFFGWAWSLANPIATVTVFTVVFGVIFKARLTPAHPSGLNSFALFLMCALLPWNYFQASVFGCLGSLIANEALIKKTYFPRQLLPASSVAAALVTHLIEMGLLMLALIGFGNWRVLPFLPMFIVLTLVTSLFALGFGLIFSALNVYFRDIQHFMGILLMVWMYMSAIVYSIDQIHSAKLRTILKLNPMTDMGLSYRAVLYDGSWPGLIQFSYFAGWALLFMVIGLYVFGKLEAGLAEEL